MFQNYPHSPNSKGVRVKNDPFKTMNLSFETFFHLMHISRGIAMAHLNRRPCICGCEILNYCLLLIEYNIINYVKYNHYKL